MILSFQDVLQQFLLAWKMNPSDQTVNTLLLLFKLIQKVVQYKNCTFVSNSASFVRLLVTILGETGLPDSFLSVAFDIGANLLLSPHLQLAHEHASLITIKVPFILKIIILNKIFHWLDYVIKFRNWRLDTSS